jgi:hypothetical protein
MLFRNRYSFEMSQKKARTFKTLKTAQKSSRETLQKREQDEKARREKTKSPVKMKSKIKFGILREI